MKSILSLLLISFAFACQAQVNMQSGSAEQSFPLINYTDSKAGINIGVGFGYSSGSGLQVNDMASDVGTGWNMDAGGAIVRVQKGEPDDQPQYTNNTFAAGTGDVNGLPLVEKNYPNGYLYNPIQNIGCNKGLTFYPVFEGTTVYKPLNVVASDEEQDQFAFHFNGRTGTFVIGKDWVPRIIGDSRIKVELSTTDMTSQGVRTTINKFVITTEDGLQYTFSELGLSQICQYKNSKQDKYGNWVPAASDNSAYALNRYIGYPMKAADRPFIVNTWFLSSIKNTNNGQFATFQYDNVSTNFLGAKNIANSRTMDGGTWNTYHIPIYAASLSLSPAQLDHFSAGPTTLMYAQSITKSKRLALINLPNGGYINFVYDPLGRADLSGENALTGINYYIGGRLVRAYKMGYGYLFKNSILPYDYKFSSFQNKFARLCLLSLQKIGNGKDEAVEPPYRFNYVTHLNWSGDDMVPARNYVAQDYWGYYNGLASAFTLSELYEDHDFLSNPKSYFKTVIGSNKNAKAGYAQLGLLSSVTYPTGGTFTYSYVQNVPGTNSSNPVFTYMPYFAGGVSVSQTAMYDGEDHNKDIIKTFKYVKENNLSSRWGDESPVIYDFNASFFNEGWRDKRHFKYPGIQYAEMAVSNDVSKLFGKAILSSLISAGIQFGVNAGLAAIGAAAAIPYLNIAIFLYSLIDFLWHYFSAVHQSNYQFTLHNQNFVLGNPLGTGYSRVEVQTNSPTGNNGKTVYDFTDLNYYPAMTPIMQWPYVQSQRTASWAYGLPIKITVFDKNGVLVSETDNAYNIIKQTAGSINTINCKCATEQTFNINEPQWRNQENTAFTLVPFNNMLPHPYIYYTGRTDLVSTISQNYNTQGQLYNTSMNLVLTDAELLLQKGKIEIKDRNTYIVTITYYPKDFTLSGAIQKLKDNNAIYTPISTETWQIKTNGAISLLDAHVTEYNTYSFSNNSTGVRSEVKPWRKYKLKANAPVPLSVIGWNNPTALLRNTDYYQLENEMQYDNDGNLIETIHYGNITSYINDYSSRYVVASIANAASSDIAYTSFESDGKGGWDFNIYNEVATDKLTGLQSYNLTGASPVTRYGLNTATTYQVTYWAKTATGSNVLVNGQAGSLLYTVPYGWSLYAATVSNVSQVNITGTSVIDELRLYPKGALMSTVAYENGIGKITECDANNRLMFYEYDGLGRLKVIRDQNRNIIKTYEYNYKK